jgi:cytoskeletal protein RodZ
MSREQKPLHTASRLDMKVKQRKINKVYNVLIVAVSLLIAIVAVTIILSGGKEPSTQTAVSDTSKESSKDQQRAAGENTESGNEGTSDTNSTTDNDDSSKTDESSDSNTDDGSSSEQSTNEADDNSQQSQSGDSQGADSNEASEPATTDQTGQHVTSFDKNSSDWKGMVQALTAATGIDQSNMTLWRLGNGGSPGTAVGTLSSKNDDKKYRVRLQWVDGTGWKPVNVEEVN